MKHKVTELKEDIDNSTTIVGFNTPFSVISEIARKVNKEMHDLDNTINQLDLTPPNKSKKHILFQGS